MPTRDEFGSIQGGDAPAGQLCRIVWLGLLSTYSVLRGVGTTLAPAGAVYSVVDYSDGFIRRGLVGQIFMAIFSRDTARDAWRAAFWSHHVAIFLLLAGLLLWLARQANKPAAGRTVAIFAIFASGQFLPTLAAVAGYLDVYVLLLALACFSLAARGQVWLAALLGAIGPVVHEMFVFYWLALLLMLVFRDGSGLLRRTDNLLAACALPVLSAALVMLFSGKAAVVAQLARAPLSPECWRTRGAACSLRRHWRRC